MPAWEAPNKEHPPPKPGEPPLHRAAREGDHEAIRRLVAEDADINAVFDMALDPSGRPCPATPLMVAAGSGDGATAETVRLLISLGADPKIATRAGSAASFATRGLGWNYRPGGDASRLAALLDAGSPLDLSGDSGSRLVAETAALGDAARLAVLLQRGAPANPCFDPEKARKRHEAMAADMRRYRESQPALFKGLSPEMLASLNDSIAQQEKEMAERAVSAPFSHEIPLFQAAESGSVECVGLLLSAGADVHQRDSSRETALWYAGTAEVAKLLVERGLRVDDHNHLEWTPLLSSLDEPKRAAALIAAGADVNATHDRGYTVFMSAAGSMERSVEVLRMLVAAGADPHPASELGYNAFHAAIDVNGEANAEDSVRATLTYLKELGVDIEKRNNRGQTPLARAIDEGNGIEVRVLCELGADPNAAARFHHCGEDACEIREELPLFAASRAAVAKDEKTEALLLAGANPIATDAEGYTALPRVVARLCAEARDYERAFTAFFERLNAVLRRTAPSAPGRTAYLATLRPALRRFIEEFARDIPIDRDSEFAPEWRRELLSAIEVLAAFESWARHGRPRRGSDG